MEEKVSIINTFGHNGNKNRVRVRGILTFTRKTARIEILRMRPILILDSWYSDYVRWAKYKSFTCQVFSVR